MSNESWNLTTHCSLLIAHCSIRRPTLLTIDRFAQRLLDQLPVLLDIERPADDAAGGKDGEVRDLPPQFVPRTRILGGHPRLELHFDLLRFFAGGVAGCRDRLLALLAGAGDDLLRLNAGSLQLLEAALLRISHFRARPLRRFQTLTHLPRAIV